MSACHIHTLHHAEQSAAPRDACRRKAASVIGDFDGFRHTVEHSVYVEKDNQGAGIGKLLMQALIKRAGENGIHVMIAGIEANNAASIALHEKLGFRNGGTFFEVGKKFGRWLDLTFMELRVPN